MWRRVLALVLVFSLLAPSAAMPAETSTDEPTAPIATGRITTTGAELIVVHDARMGEQAVSFKRTPTGTPETLPLADILRLEEQTGDSGPAYALGGGLGGLVGGIIGVSIGSSGSSSEEVSSGTKTTVVAVMTGLGAVIGYAIGSGQKKYDVIYENPILGLGGGTAPGATLAPGTQKIAQLSLRF